MEFPTSFLYLTFDFCYVHYFIPIEISISTLIWKIFVHLLLSPFRDLCFKRESMKLSLHQNECVTFIMLQINGKMNNHLKLEEGTNKITTSINNRLNLIKSYANEFIYPSIHLLNINKINFNFCLKSLTLNIFYRNFKF